jgi:hypothetical protein
LRLEGGREVGGLIEVGGKTSKGKSSH